MYAVVKRAIDILFSLFALIVLLPFFLVIMIVLKSTGEREVFYLQERVGYKNRRFKVWKFATMLRNSPNLPGGEITVRDDPRITPFGRYLRITKINELPQLINVLRGEMSLVGPRPLMPVSFAQFPEDVQQHLYDSRPGLTGIGSVIFRDEEKLVSEADEDPRTFYRERIFPYKASLEMWYQDHKSLWTDFLIIALTVLELIVPGTRLPHLVFRDLPEQPSGASGPSP